MAVTFMVIASEHPIIDKYSDRISNMDEITSYRNACAKKTEFERTQLVKDKTGVCIKGLDAVNPVNGKKIRVYFRLCYDGIRNRRNYGCACA